MQGKTLLNVVLRFKQDFRAFNQESSLNARKSCLNVVPAIQAGFPCIQAGIQLECKEILLERGARHLSMISVHVIKHVRNGDSADLSVFCPSAWPLLRAGAEVNDLGPCGVSAAGRG